MSEIIRPTIFALSSGRPPAAIAVIRISGPRAGEALKALTGKIPAPRQAAFVRVRDPETKAVIDEGLALFFPATRSETGEDVAELQLHGGRAVIAATLAALGRLESLRPAEAGEFTRRAFENGKLDLTAVEGLADLVMAETEGQRAQALRQMQGALRGRVESWRDRLIQALALVEARIDFSDEADVPEHLIEPALAIARALVQEIEAALADDKRGERLREGLVVAIAGPPNAGKSTLLNRIARREAAIVSPYAGTTRDVVEVHLDLGGWPVTLLDTAGIRDTDDPVEMEGVRRARARAAAADLVLWVVDAGSSVIPGHAEGAGPEAMSTDREHGLQARAPLPSGQSLSSGRPLAGPVGRAPGNDREIASHPAAPADSSPPGDETRPAGPPIWLIRNKIDLIRAPERSESCVWSVAKDGTCIHPNNSLKDMVNKGLPGSDESIVSKSELIFSMSAASSEGFAPLFSALARHAETFLGGAEPAVVTRERHRRALEDALAALRRVAGPNLAGREDLLAEELRLASRALARLTGRVDVEDILDVIFRDFCIGK